MPSSPSQPEPSGQNETFPLVVAKNERRRKREATKAKRPIPVLPLDWPPTGWETPQIPVNSSPEAIQQWFSLAIGTLEQIEVLDLHHGKCRMEAAGRYYRDAFRLLRAIRPRPDFVEDEKPDPLTPHQTAVILRGLARRLQGETPGKAARKPKRSTERGEGRAKLIGALTKHHQYADGGCLNQEPIGNNELAKAAEVVASTASMFFKDKFKGHTKYKALCRDAGKLAAALKLLNDEFAPYHLLGAAASDLAAPEQDDADSE